MSSSAVYFLHALSPLHPGTGQGVGSIDLPVAREKATGVPYLPGSSVKGVLRDAARTQEWPGEKVAAIFGPETDNASDHAGAAYFGDAKLLLLPVRSYAGVFAYATSPFLLRRFKRELEAAGFNNAPPPPTEPEDVSKAIVTSSSKLLAKGSKVYLEDLDFSASQSDELGEWEKWLTEKTAGLEAPIKGRLLYLHDDAMTFLLETALEVVARIRIDENKKTVAKGALWYEENIPSESILYGLVSAAPKTFGGIGGKQLPAEETLAALQGLLKSPLQFGGNATIGRGLCKVNMLSADAAEEART